MFRKLALSLLLTVTAFTVCKNSFAITYVWDGSVNTYTLTSADSLHIPSGTFTGTITAFPAGAKISIAFGATFQPSSFPNANGANSAKGIMWVWGTFTFNTTFNSNTDFTLHNYGMVTLGNTTLRGSNQTWTNNYGATINFTSDVLMNGDPGDNNIIHNYETINCTGNFQMNSGSAVYNYKDMNVTGNYRVNGGTLSSQGNIIVTGNILMNNGASVIRNYCRMEASDGITNTSGNFYNYSYLRAINSDITNSANIINASVSVAGSPLSRPMIEGRSYFHSTGGTMTGPALLYFTNTTSITGGTIGVAGATTDTIKMNDITRSQPTQILDVQSGGTLHPNVIYNAWGVPDPSYTYLFGCSLEIFLEIPLAINWKSFEVVLSDNIPLLLWAAEFDNKTVFEIERSYDGRNFSTIDKVVSEDGKNDYRYNDRSVDDQLPAAYYRIRAVELDGEIKYSQIRMVRFSNKGSGSLQVAPNPFRSSLSLLYQSAETGNVTIRIFNVNGQQKLVKKASVNKGNNNITLTEVAQFASGIYVVQVTNDKNLHFTSKIVKQ